jgi:hypothetical protein
MIGLFPESLNGDAYIVRPMMFVISQQIAGNANLVRFVTYRPGAVVRQPLMARWLAQPYNDYRSCKNLLRNP